MSIEHLSLIYRAIVNNMPDVSSDVINQIVDCFDKECDISNGPCDIKCLSVDNEQSFTKVSRFIFFSTCALILKLMFCVKVINVYDDYVFRKKKTTLK